MSDNIKKEILDKKIDDDQLDKITGGGADGNGSCEANYYAENCVATVEAGSHCGFSQDYCDCIACGYTQPGGCTFNSHTTWEEAKREIAEHREF